MISSAANTTMKTPCLASISLALCRDLKKKNKTQIFDLLVWSVTWRCYVPCNKSNRKNFNLRINQYIFTVHLIYYKSWKHKESYKQHSVNVAAGVTYLKIKFLQNGAMKMLLKTPVLNSRYYWHDSKASSFPHSALLSVQQRVVPVFYCI